MINKKAKLFTIDVEVYSEFKIICKLLSISASSMVESMMGEFVVDNKEFINTAKAHMKDAEELRRDVKSANTTPTTTTNKPT